MSVKSEVLRFFEKNNSYTSGQAIADKLGVSRNSVWKAVKALEEDGFVFESSTNKGYRLVSSKDVLSADGIRSHLVKFPDIPIHFFDETDSTNRVAKSLAISGAPEGTLVVADCQSAGRGRLGRSFFSPHGVGIYFTLIIRPESLFETAPLITTAASVAVAKAVREKCGKDAVIKWVNDVYISGKKICGILSEAVTDMESGRVECVVIGIGINFYPGSFPDEIKDIASPIFNEKGNVTRNELTASIVDELLDIISKLPDKSFMKTYRELSMVIGKDVVCFRGNEKFEGRVKDIDDFGGLVIERDGSTEVLRSGEISLRLKTPATSQYQSQADLT
jgi:BirA family biotin operon repressor/biotin-[acetyl-CoA-carboxylase] ligase